MAILSALWPIVHAIRIELDRKDKHYYVTYLSSTRNVAVYIPPVHNSAVAELISAFSRSMMSFLIGMVAQEQCCSTERYC